MEKVYHFPRTVVFGFCAALLGQKSEFLAAAAGQDERVWRQTAFLLDFNDIFRVQIVEIFAVIKALGVLFVRNSLPGAFRVDEKVVAGDVFHEPVTRTHFDMRSS